MMRKIFDVIIAFIFISFAYLQLNDPDPWFWILLYLIIAINALLSLFGKLTRKRLLASVLVFAILLIANFHNVIQWIQQGTPDIVNFTEETVDIAEKIREYFGLLISFGVLLIYAFLQSREVKRS